MKLKDQPGGTYGDNGDSVGIVGKFWIQLGQWEHPIYPMLFVIFFPFTAINFIIEALGPTQWNIWDQWGIWRFIGLKRGFIGNSGDLVVTLGVQWEQSGHSVFGMLFLIFFEFTASNFIIEV